MGHTLDHSLCRACASLTDVIAMKINRRWGGDALRGAGWNLGCCSIVHAGCGRLSPRGNKRRPNTPSRAHVRLRHLPPRATQILSF